MELVLNAGGEPAPRLIDCAMGPDEAVAHHRDLLGMVVRMLSCDMIHGDLSPFNILLAWNGCTIIDLPQVVLVPHIGSATGQTRQAMADLAFGNLRVHCAGRPVLTPVPECAAT
jgi:RIO kinase 1